MRWHEAPLVPLAGAFAIGIAASAWGTAPAWWLLGAGTLVLGLTGLALALGSAPLTTAGLLALAMLLGAARAISDPLPADHIARVAFGPLVSVEGRLAEEPVRWTPDRTRLLVDLDGLRDGLDLRTVSGRLQVTLYGETPPVGEGQRVALDLKLSRPRAFRNPGSFDYPAFLRREGILLVGSGRADSLLVLTADDPPWPVRVKRWAVSTIAAHLPPTSAALLGGLLLGEKTGLPPEAGEAFRRAGVYHILAVSGFNVALLASSIFFALSTLGVPRRVTAVVAGAGLVGFALVVGGQASVLRATVMGLLLLGALLLDRESQLMNALALAVLLLLAWRPGDLGEPGFQLSFAATAGIIYLAPTLTAYLTGRGWPGWLATSTAVSLGAQAAVTPVMLVHFNQLSLIGVVANLVVVPLAAVGTTLGMLALLTAAVSASVADIVFPALWLLLLALRAVVWAAARLPAAMVHLPAPGWLAIAAWCVALALVPCLGSARRWIRPAAVASLALAVVSRSGLGSSQATDGSASRSSTWARATLSWSRRPKAHDSSSTAALLAISGWTSGSGCSRRSCGTGRRSVSTWSPSPIPTPITRAGCAPSSHASGFASSGRTGAGSRAPRRPCAPWSGPERVGERSWRDSGSGWGRRS